jgi:hypothetical protein
MDRSHILQLGQRRPASTGVIGGIQSSSSAVLHSLGLGGNGAVRPAAKTLMDLIQEDFPPESPLDAGDLYGTDFQRDQAFAMERPRTTSPLSSQYNSMRGGDQYIVYGRGSGGRFDDQHGMEFGGGDNDILDSLDQLHLGIGDSSYPPNNMVSVCIPRKLDSFAVTLYPSILELLTLFCASSIHRIEHVRHPSMLLWT